MTKGKGGKIDICSCYFTPLSIMKHIYSLIVAKLLYFFHQRSEKMSTCSFNHFSVLIRLFIDTTTQQFKPLSFNRHLFPLLIKIRNKKNPCQNLSCEQTLRPLSYALTIFNWYKIYNKKWHCGRGLSILISTIQFVLPFTGVSFQGFHTNE